MEQQPSNKWQFTLYKVWSIIGILVIIVAAITVCGYLHTAITALIVSAILVFLMHGSVNRLEKKGIPRIWGAIICFIVFFGIIAATMFLIIPSITEQVKVLADVAPQYIDGVIERMDAFYIDLAGTQSTNPIVSAIVAESESWLESGALTSGINNIASSLGHNVFAGLSNIGTFALTAFIALVVVFWLLLDLPKIGKEIRILAGEKHSRDIDIFTEKIGNAVYGWVKATLICSAVSGIICCIIFVILKVPYPILLGTVCGISYIIPYLGPIIACIICGFISIFASPLLCVLSIVTNIVVHNAVANLLSPKLMKDSINIHPAVILIAILIGQAIAGALGMIISVPIAAAAQGIFVVYFEEKTGRTLYSENGALFQKTKEKQRKQIHLPKIMKK